MTSTSSESYPVPDNDEERLRALYYYDILDTRPEDAFDRLTDIARTVFDVEMGCDVYQGYYTSKPLPAGDFSSFLASRK